jgi:4-hydroxybenzoate polyprenyltransferase
LLSARALFKRAGAIAPDAALLLSSLLYCGCLIAACLMEPSRLRSIVAFSAAATLLYTPLFKKLTGVKNATVATVIALAPLAGALAAGAVSSHTPSPVLLCLLKLQLLFR